MSNQKERLRAVVERVFPTGTRLVAPPGDGDYVLLASWKLGTDPKRPNKRSKTIGITVSEEAMDDWSRVAVEHQSLATARFEALIKHRLATFDPAHDTPPGTEPPIERWIVGTAELNG